MEWFIYRSDDAATRDCPARQLTPRAMFRATDRRDALAAANEYESYRWPEGRPFGKSAITAATRREINSPSFEQLPDLNQLLVGEREAADVV